MTGPIIGNVTFDCSDANRLADFWAAALGWEKEDVPRELLDVIERELGPDQTNFAAVRNPDGTRPRLYFQGVPEDKVVKNRVHLDIVVPDMDAEVGRLIGLGASMVERRSHEAGDFFEEWTVMQDSEGNEFCVQPSRGSTEV